MAVASSKVVAVAPKSAKSVKPSAPKSNGKKHVNGNPTERHYGLDKETVKELRAEKVINPWREGSTYHAIAQALIDCGMGKFHGCEKLLKAFQQQLDKSKLSTFKQKEKRNAETGLDWKQRIIQSAYVLTRKDYGKCARDLGYEVRMSKDDKGEKQFGFFKLSAK